MAYTIRISKSGYSALTETDPNRFILHSEYNTFKIIAEGSALSQNVTGNPTTFTVAHGQSATPAVYAFAKFPDGYIALPTQAPRDSVSPYTTDPRYWLVEVDGTNVIFKFYKGGTANYSVDFKYYIFETPGT